MEYAPLAGAYRGTTSGARTPARLSMQAKRAMLYSQLMVCDVVLLLLGSSLAMLTQPGQFLPINFYPMLAVCAAYVFCAISYGGYSVGALRSAADSVRLGLSALIPAVLLVMLVAFLLKGSEHISRMIFMTSVVFGGMFLVIGRTIFSRYAAHVLQGRLLNKLVIVDGKLMQAWDDATAVIEAGLANLKPDLTDPQMLDRFGCIALGFEQIVIDSVPERQRDWALLLKGANVDGEIVIEEHDELGAIGFGTGAEGRSSMLVSRRPLRMHDRIGKRCFDLALTVPIIIALIPLLAIVAIVIKFDTPGPVLFKQDRIGRGNRLFKVLKFRSMRVEGSDPRGMRSTSRNDDRITRVGKFIRATSIDELPQLFNVLLGDMSLVGPRPHPIGSLAEGKLFWDIDITYWHRHQLKPGITGLAQVRGFRGATHQLSDLTDRLQADMEYIQDWNLWRDLHILVSTVRVVVHRNAF